MSIGDQFVCSIEAVMDEGVLAWIQSYRPYVIILQYPSFVIL